jgi:hypothetical protein
MSTDFDKSYGVLGVKPGVSVRDLKTAHRDLAKVWHPDRFVHDPDLREKAQEKLKEINAAYELLTSGKLPRRTPEPPPTYATQQPMPRRQSPRRRSHRFGLVLLMFMAVFALTVSVLLQTPQNRAPVVEMATENEEETSTPPDVYVSRSSQPKTVGSSHRAALESLPAVAPVQPLATVTVVVDAHTGLLATPNCPQPTRMTYPNGNEPRAYCKTRHPPRITATSIETEPQKNSLIKSIAKRAAF